MASMWLPCSVVIDEPIMVLLWEFEDFQVIAMSPFILHFLAGPLLAFVGAIAAAIAAYFLKRGKPAGALWHWLHGLELMPLPGVLSPYPQRYSPW